MIRKYWCLALAAFVYFWTLYYWFKPDEIDILWSSIVNYLVFFPVCGIMLGIHYGRCRSNRNMILTLPAAITTTNTVRDTNVTMAVVDLTVVTHK